MLVEKGKWRSLTRWQLHLEYYENGTRVDPVDFGKKYIRFLDKDKDYENVKI